MMKRVLSAVLPIVFSALLCTNVSGMVIDNYDIVGECNLENEIILEDEINDFEEISDISEVEISENTVGLGDDADSLEKYNELKSVINELAIACPPAVIYGDDECKVYLSVEDIYDDYVSYTDAKINNDTKLYKLQETVLPVGTTVYLEDVVFVQTDNLVRVVYLIKYCADGIEYLGYIPATNLVFSDEKWLEFERNYLVPDEYIPSEDISLITQSVINENNSIGLNNASEADDELINNKATTYADVEKFPVSYQSKLNAIKKAHSNWVVVPLKTGLDFNTAVNNEMGEKSYIYKNDSNLSKGFVGGNTGQANWAYATKSAVSYFMDPRNYFTESNIFAFEQLTFNSSYHSESAVASFLNGTFMRGNIPGESRTYANAFYTIGLNRKLSPTHLASRVYQEQGKGTSPLISGTYPGFEGYYNFFNVGATGSTSSEVIASGLKYAKEKGWNTRYKSLDGGASTIGNGYLLKGQDTIYLEKYNVSPNATNPTFTHQYMQNVQAPMTEGNSTYKIYAEAGSINAPFVFKIPVYENMPCSVSLSKSSATLKLNETLTLTLKDTGVEIASNQITWKSSNTSIATVKDGVVKAVGINSDGTKGVATITATYNNSEYNCTITVVNPIESITLSKTELVLRREDTVVANTKGFTDSEKAANVSEYDLEVAINPKNTTDDATITYSSSNKKVATVDKTGKVKAVGIGSATITVVAANASGSTKPKASCKVEVIAPVYRIELKDTYANSNGENDAERAKGKNVIYKGQTVNLMYEYWPKDTTDDIDISFTSSKNSVASISKGMVTGREAGSATLTLSISHYSSSIDIKVKKCRAQFMKKDGTAVLKEYEIPFGSTVAECEAAGTLVIPAETSLKLSEDEVFFDFYTEANGKGSKLDESFAFEQEITKFYPYIEENDKEFYVKPLGDYVYTGSAVKPEPFVYEKGADGTSITRLTKGVDYKVSYSNNVKISSSSSIPMVKVTGCGNYVGAINVNFGIVKKSLNSADISCENISLNYNKNVQKAAPVLYRNGKKLKKNTDYVITYPLTDAGAYKNKGTYPIKIEGKGGYSGSIVVYETITEKINLSKVSVKVSNVKFDRKRINPTENVYLVPEYSVTYKGASLIFSEDGKKGDYTVSFSNNDRVGTATLTINATDASAYYGTKTVQFSVLGNKLSSAKVYGIAGQEYTGNSEDVKQVITSEVSGFGVSLRTNDGVCLKGIEEDEYVKLGIKEKLDYDYLVSYKNINKTGTASVIFSGVNGFNGTIKKTYKITKCNISNSVQNVVPFYYKEEEAVALGLKVNKSGIGASIDELTKRGVAIRELKGGDCIYDEYVKGGSKPQMLIKVNGIYLTGKDFTVTYKNNTKISVPENNIKGTVILTGKGNYTGSLSFDMFVSRTDLSESIKSVTAPDMVYSVKAGGILSKLTILDCNGAALKIGTDYARNLEYNYKYVTDVVDKFGNKLPRSAGEKVQVGDIPAAGTVISISTYGINNYTGAVSADYRISKVNLNNKKIKVAIKSQTYMSGVPVTLKPEDLTVTYSGVKLRYGVDYTIDDTSYLNNITKGTASVTIVALKSDSNYGGRRVINFKILPKNIIWF